MTNPPKTHDVIEHEAPSANEPDVAHEHMPSMPFDPSMTAVAQGHVEGAWSITALGADWMPKKALLLPEGRTMKVERGTAIRVQSADGWHHCEFPQSGMLHGPVVWAAAEAASEQDLLDSLENRDEWFAIVGFSAGALIFLFSMFYHEAYLHSSAWSLPYRLGAVFMSFGAAVGTAFGVGYLVRSQMERLSPRTIKSVDRRVTKTLRMPRSVLHALGAPQPHLQLVAPEQPMDELDRESRDHLETYHAQRAKLVTKQVSSNPMMEHTATMLEEISLRLGEDNAALRRDDLRRTYLELIQRAEADVSLALEKKDTEAADALIEDMSALLRQMDRHKR